MTEQQDDSTKNSRILGEDTEICKIRFSDDMQYGVGEIAGEACLVARSEKQDSIVVIDLESIVTLMMAYEYFCLPPEEEGYN